LFLKELVFVVIIRTVITEIENVLDNRYILTSHIKDFKVTLSKESNRNFQFKKSYIRDEAG